MTSASIAHATPASRAWMLDLVLLGALWGASYLFMRMAVPEFGALPTAAIRVGISSLTLLPILWWQGQAPMLAQHWRGTMLIGVFNSGVPFALFCFALLYINSGLAAVLNATVPMFGALVAWLWLGDKPDGSRLLGLAIGFLGVAALAAGTAGIKASGGDWSVLLAVLACLAGALSYGIAASATKKHLAKVPSLVNATGSQLGAFALLVVPALFTLPQRMPGRQAWLALAVLGVACTGIAYILFFRLIARAGPARALTVTFLVPVFAVCYGAFFLHERVTVLMLFCAAVIVAGVALSAGLVRGRRHAGPST